MSDEVRNATLSEVSTLLLAKPKTAAKWLTVADKYIQAYAENPNTFLLPKAHGFLKPLVDTYHGRLDGFVEYILRIRDSIEKEHKAWDEVQEVYRRINGRLTQQIRRERSNRAIAKAEEMYGETDYQRRLIWVARLEHTWAGRRLDFMEARRSKGKRDRLTSDERTELLLEFWDIIDTEILEGKGLPHWDSVNLGATQR